MQLRLKDYLEDQLRDPLPAFTIEGMRRVEVMKPLSWDGVDYPGPDPKDYHRRGQVLELPVAAAKQFYRESKIRFIIEPTDRGSGPWDVYRIEDRLGFWPWPDPAADRTGLVPQLPKSEFDDCCWLPVRERRNGSRGYGEIFFLPYWLAQKIPLRGDQGWESSSIIIDLPQTTARERLVYS